MKDITDSYYNSLVAEIKALLPKEERIRLFNKECCEYEVGGSDEFFGFLQVYDTVRKHLPSNITTIIDFGCNMAVQSYLFSGIKNYIGVDVSCGIDEDGLIERFTPPNASHIVMEIKEYIRLHRDAHNKDNVFAICSYVPDAEAEQAVDEAYDNCHIYYPGRTNVLKVNGKYLINYRNNRGNT